jgi:hypothetical protein
MYNINYTIKNIGYFQNYIYKYKDFLINKNLLDPFLLKDKSYIIYICLKNGIEYNLTGICYFIEYIQFISLLNESLNDLELKLNIKSNEINTIIIKI